MVTYRLPLLVIGQCSVGRRPPVVRHGRYHRQRGEGAAVRMRH